MKWFSNLRVAYKVLVSCGLFIVLLMIGTVLSISSIRSTEKAINNYRENRVLQIINLNNMMKNLLEIEVRMNEQNMALQERNTEMVRKLVEETKVFAENYQKIFKTYLEVKKNAEEQKLSDDFEASAKKAAETRSRYREVLLAGDLQRSTMYLNEWQNEFNSVTQPTAQKLVDLQIREGKALFMQNEKESAQTMVMLYILLALSLGIGIVITFVLARSVSNPVRKGLDFAERIAEGDLTDRIDLDQNDELGQLAKALNVSAESLEKFVSEVLVSSQNLAQAVEQIATGNQNLSQRTSEQASSLEEIASTIEEATAAIRQNADNSNEANKLAEVTTKMAEEGNRVVIEAVASINEINKSSKKIEEIISLINEISFQTNLLALNAAVEAARAGEQGRGFAVVAGEVRNLAQRSASAAKEIGSLIKDSIEKIGVGTDLSNRSGDALREIVASMKNVARIISEIAAASHEQKQGIDQINIAVSEMDTMTQQNAALVEETASASEEMSSQAKELQAMVERFKINENKLGNVYSVKHKEVHLRAAESSSKKHSGGNGRDKKPAAVMEKLPETPEASTAASGKNIKDVLKEEGFEEF